MNRSLIPFRLEEEMADVLQTFEDLWYSAHMPYLASDLLDSGFTPSEVVEAMRRAMTACEQGGLPVHRHFQMVYTSRGGSLVRDCKLTRFGYALTLLNASPRHPDVARWQLRVLRHYLER